MKFSSFNLKPDLINALSALGYVDATKVQDVVIPKALKGENIIVKSETGSGKTHSFLVPILNNLEFNSKIQAIIISPTRELARQTYNFAVKFNEFFPKLNVRLFVSGIDTTRNEKTLEAGFEIAIATPGRLKSLLNSNYVDFSCLKTIVLDEADMLFDAGFIEDIDEIISRTKNPQIEVFSATFSKRIEHFLVKYISADYQITISEENNTAKTVKHYFINTKHRSINELVLSFIKIVNPYLLMIFASDRKDAKSIYEFLSNNGYKAGFLSGEMKTRERNSMLRRINKNEFPIIVATDIASRGLDIIDVTEVLSLSLPNNLEYYYHRAGRTGRNNKDGKSYIFYNNETQNSLKKLINEGLEGEFLKIGPEGFTSDRSPFEKRRMKTHVETDLDREIKKVVSQTKSNKVKPGYKKKVKIAVDKVKRKHRREIIRKDIRRQRVERYKNAAKNK